MSLLLLSTQLLGSIYFVDHSPNCGVHTAVVELFVVQLSKKREQDLDTSYRVDGTVDGVGNNGLHILWDGNGWKCQHSQRLLYCMYTERDEINHSLTAIKN